jgi:DNA-binding MarR family transcriptional regulator
VRQRLIPTARVLSRRMGVAPIGFLVALEDRPWAWSVDETSSTSCQVYSKLVYDIVVTIDRQAVPSTGWLIWQVALRCRTATDRALAPVGLSNAQYGVLASLAGLSRDGTNPSQRQLAEFAGLEPMTVSKLVRALERDGLIERTEDPADSRAIRLNLTKPGLTVLTEARRIVTDLNEHLLVPLGGPNSHRTNQLHEGLIALFSHLDQEKPT